MSSLHLSIGHGKNHQIQSKSNFKLIRIHLPLSYVKNTQVQGLFTNKFNCKYTDFNEDLLRYSTVVTPLIQSLWSLEAADANTADIFLFWLASAATLKDLFDQNNNKTGIPHSLTNEVMEIYNKHYEEFF